MTHYKKMTSGENLKRIRNELDLRQYEIVGGEITRNLISLIENDKTPLIEKNARIICKNINKIMRERNLDIHIEPKDILIPERYDANKKADTYIKELEGLIKAKNFTIDIEYINEIELFLNEWNLTYKKMRIYELIGDIYYNLKDYNNEHAYLIKAWESSLNYLNEFFNYKLALKLTASYINMTKYDDCIKLCDFALLNKNRIVDKYIKGFYYNKALAYIFLNLFEQSLVNLENAKQYIRVDDYSQFKKVYILEGNCYFELKNYDKALDRYNKVVNSIDHENNKEELYLAYTNILNIYMDKNDETKVLEYLNLILENLSAIDQFSFYLDDIYYNIGNAYEYLNEYKLQEKYLEQSLIISRENNNNKLYIKTILELFDCYYKDNNINKLDNLIDTYKDEIPEVPLDDNTLLIFKTLLYYLEQDNELPKQFIKNIIEKEKEENNDEV